MESRPESPAINPYAPPKTDSKGGVNTRYLEHDGYSFGNELISNEHFISPLICAKLGIPINEEDSPKPIPITVMRKVRPLYNIISLVTFVIICLCAFFAYGEFRILIILSVVIVTPVLKRLLSKPYKIPFYFSEHYIQLRRRRKIIFSSALGLFAIGIAYAFMMKHSEVASLCIPGFIITGIIFQFKISRFIVTQSKDEFHYIRGVHQNLLDALPPLPLATTGQQIDLTSKV